MTLCTHECLFSMQVDGPRFDERSCEGLVATQADNRRHANKLVGQLDLAKIQVFDYRSLVFPFKEVVLRMVSMKNYNFFRFFIFLEN